MDLSKRLADFNRYFTSSNSAAPNARISVPTSEWRALHQAIADSLASAGGVEVVGYIWKFSNQDEEIVFLDSARIAWREDEPKPVSQVELVAKDAHLAALSKEREVADGLRAELEVVKRDAARYRWLRDLADAPGQLKDTPMCVMTNEDGDIISMAGYYLTRVRLDEAIDEAMGD